MSEKIMNAVTNQEQFDLSDCDSDASDTSDVSDASNMDDKNDIDNAATNPTTATDPTTAINPTTATNPKPTRMANFLDNMYARMTKQQKSTHQYLLSALIGMICSIVTKQRTQKLTNSTLTPAYKLSIPEQLGAVNMYFGKYCINVEDDYYVNELISSADISDPRVFFRRAEVYANALISLDECQAIIDNFTEKDEESFNIERVECDALVFLINNIKIWDINILLS